MHLSVPTLLAACSLYLTSSSASLTDIRTPGLSETVNHLDSNGLLDWKPTADGGRTTTIPTNLVAQAFEDLEPGSSQKLEARKGPKEPQAHVGHFNNIGQIAGYAAAYACEKDGDWSVSSRVDDSIVDACASLVLQVPEVPIAMSMWKIYQSPQQPGADGSSLSVYFRWYTRTAYAPVLTWDVCEDALKELTSWYCQGKDKHSTDSQGGEIRIGGGDDYLMIGYDPNSL